MNHFVIITISECGSPPTTWEGEIEVPQREYSYKKVYELAKKEASTWNDVEDIVVLYYSAQKQTKTKVV